MLSAKLKEAAGNSADATLYVDDVFSTYLYTGNGSTQTINNGIDLAGKGGLVWCKQRSSTENHFLFDTARGVNKYLQSTNTSGQTTVTATLPAFNANGFDVGGNGPNTSPTTYASWTFRKAAKFFDVVTWTGNGVGGATVSHNLGVAPGMIIFKATSSASNWFVYHQSLGLNGSLILNGTDANPGYGRVSAVSSSSFTTDGTGNGFGVTYVAYLYAHDTSSTGIIQCGSFTTTSSNQINPVTLGWEPQFIMWKQTSGATAWFMADTMRGWDSNGNSQQLSPNSANQESADTAFAHPNATGFSGGTAAMSATYIYMAIRRPNKPPTTGTQVYASVARTGTNTVGQSTSFGQVTDLVFTKRRAGGTPQTWAWTDRLRGPYVELTSVTAVAEASYADDVTGFDSMTGFKFGSGAGGQINDSAINYVDSLFKRAPGFFDEVCYTGTGVATTQAHNLTVVPEMIITKSRNNAASWLVYNAVLGNTKATIINSTNASSAYSPPAWNDTTPTSTVFSIGTNPSNNTSGGTYVAYLFATLAGISKVGSYTGNGTGQAIACGFGSGGARFVLIKRTDDVGAWYTFDSARGLTSGSSPYLLLNSTAAEVTGNNGVYASSGGFTLGATASLTTNIIGASYIFLSVS